MDEQDYQYFAQRIASLQERIRSLEAFVAASDIVVSAEDFGTEEHGDNCARMDRARAAVGELGE